MTTIQEWAAGLSDWQSDALRRQLRASDLTQDEYAAIFANAKAAFGVGIPTKPERCSELASTQELTTSEVVSLLSVGPMNAVDRLAEDQTLNFSEDGVTAIYGNNGVGKSGYSRVLKQLCRAVSGSKVGLRGDAFKVSLKSPKVSVAFRVGEGEPETATWQRGDVPPSQISRISVFDSTAARLYVNEQNEIDYLPWQVELVSRHRRTIERVRTDAQRSIAEIDLRLSRTLPTFRSGTSAFDIASRLKMGSENPPSSAEIDAASGWGESYEKKLKGLQSALHSDPGVIRSALNLADQKVRALAVAVHKVQRKFSQAAISRIEGLKYEEDAAALTVLAAREVSLAVEPLDKTGSQLWKSLFFAARKFAAEAGYTRPFEQSSAGDACVLCQQPLSDEAAERMRRFDAFVSNEAAVNLQVAEENMLLALDAYKSLLLPSIEDVRSAVLVAEPLADIEALEAAVEFQALVLSKTMDLDAIRGVASAIPEGLVARLAQLSRELRARSRSIDASSGPQVIKGIEIQIAELEDRKTITDITSDVRSRSSDVKVKLRLNKLIEECGDASIARFITNIRREFLTEDLAKNIREEMGKLGLSGIPVSFSDKTKADKSFGGVSIDGMLLPLKNSDILSEGEQRALALSVFVAEMRMISSANAIIVDDPVSSLDYARMRKVARRLAEIGRDRQVIVFTHNMSFFAELRDAGSEFQTPTTAHYMFRGASGYGNIQSNAVPWELKKLKERIVDLRQEITKFNVNVSPEQYKLSVKTFSVMLRESWERLVEEKLFYEVVLRYARPVHTLRLRGVSVTDDDFSRVYYAIKRASEWSGHDAPIGAAIEPPTLDELSQAIDEIENYAKEIDAARQAIEQQRKLRIPLGG